MTVSSGGVPTPGDLAQDAPSLCPACALAERTGSRLYHVRCLGPDRCGCTHEPLKEVLFRG